MKIAVCGSGTGEDKEVFEKAKEIGKEIAKSNNILLTGGCSGYPYAAVRGAILENGKVICFSPAKDKEEHVTKYGFPFEENVEYIFTGKGIPGRNLPLVQNADKVVIIGGQIGTLNEFTIAFQKKKPIFVLGGSGGITDILPKIAEVCGKGVNGEVVYISDPKELVSSPVHN